MYVYGNIVNNITRHQKFVMLCFQSIPYILYNTSHNIYDSRILNAEMRRNFPTKNNAHPFIHYFIHKLNMHMHACHVYVFVGHLLVAHKNLYKLLIIKRKFIFGSGKCVTVEC